MSRKNIYSLPIRPLPTIFAMIVGQKFTYVTCCSISVDVEVWDHVVGLYPYLIDCVTCNSNEVRLLNSLVFLKTSELLNLLRQLKF